MADAILAGSGIYAIRNAHNGKCYVGSAASIRRRFWEHRSLLARGRHRSPKLQAAWSKHGAEAFRFEVLEIVANKERLVEREQHWINACGALGRSGYNICPVAGSTLGRRPSAATRARLSQARTGRQLSEEHRRNIAAGNRGRIFAAETRAKISVALRGRPKGALPAETCLRMSLAHKGRPRGPMSAEQKAKLSASHMGKSNGPHSPATREKISATKRAQAAQKRLAAQ